MENPRRAACLPAHGKRQLDQKKATEKCMRMNREGKTHLGKNGCAPSRVERLVWSSWREREGCGDSSGGKGETRTPRGFITQIGGETTVARGKRNALLRSFLSLRWRDDPDGVGQDGRGRMPQMGL